MAEGHASPSWLNLRDVPVFDATRDGVAGNGTTDDYAAIMRTVAKAQAAGSGYLGGEVQLPVGKFKISQPIVLPRQGTDLSPIVRIRGAGPQASMLVGASNFPANRGMIEWGATTERVMNNSVTDMGFSLPDVLGVRAIKHSFNKAGGLATAVRSDIETEWFQCDMVNLYIEASNKYHDVLIDLGVGNRVATMRNIIADPWRGLIVGVDPAPYVATVYDTLLIQTPHQYGGVDAPHGEDSIGLGLMQEVRGLQPMVLRGGWVKTFKGRVYNSAIANIFQNGPMPGRAGAIGYEFRNSFQVTLENLASEGGGGDWQFLFNNCRAVIGNNLTIPVGAASGTPAWAPNTVYAAGAVVIPTTLFSGSGTPLPLTNRVYTVTTPGTSGGTEPAWNDTGTTVSGTATFTASAGLAASNGIKLESCENCHFTGHFAGPSAPPAKNRLTKAIVIDAASRFCSFEKWTLRVQVTGGTMSGNTDAAPEVSLLAPDDSFNYIEGSGVQSFTNWRIPFKLGVDPKAPMVRATLDFPSLAAGTSQTLTVTVPSADVGDLVAVTPPVNFSGFLIVKAYASAGNTVSIAVSNPTASTIDPPSGQWAVMVRKS